MSSYFEWTTMIDRGMDPDVHLGPNNLLAEQQKLGARRVRRCRTRCHTEIASGIFAFLFFSIIFSFRPKNPQTTFSGVRKRNKKLGKKKSRGPGVVHTDGWHVPFSSVLKPPPAIRHHHREITSPLGSRCAHASTHSRHVQSYFLKVPLPITRPRCPFERSGNFFKKYFKV